MSLEFHEASCIVAGTFNIYIIRPDWLGKIGLLTEGAEVKFEERLTAPGFRLTSSTLGGTWIVQPNRLAVETKDPKFDCGSTIDRVLEHLPWTPLAAIGCNVTYRGSSSSISGWEAKATFPPTKIPATHELKQRAWHAGIERGDEVFNLQITEKPEFVEVGANVHVDLQRKDADFARSIARSFFEFRNQSVSLIQRLFDARFADDAKND